MTLNYAREKHPFEYILTPRVMEKGTNWIKLKLKNIGQKPLKNLDVKLHSLDTSNLSIYGAWWFGAGQFIEELSPNKSIELVFQINIVNPADVYVTIKGHGYEDGNYWWWESGRTNIRIGDEKAELLGLFVLSTPIISIGTNIVAEAIIKSLIESDQLSLQFWVDTPSGRSEDLVRVALKNLTIGEESRYTVEIAPNETGFYNICAYLYDGWEKIGSKFETIYVQK